MVKVYKTNVEDSACAQTIITEIRNLLPGSHPTFDLEDCDNVLRIEHSLENIKEQDIRDILTDSGHHMEVLP